MTFPDDRSEPPQLGYLVVSGRRGAVATPAFFGVAGDRYWIAARRTTAKVRHLMLCDRASLLMPARDSWRLVTGNAKVLDPLRAASLLHALPDLVSAPAGLLDHLKANGRSLLGLWAARPELLIQVGTAFKVLICLRAHQDRERLLETPAGRHPMVVIATEVDSFPVAAVARQESRNVVRLPSDATAAILPHTREIRTSITTASGNPVDPDGSVAFGRAISKSDTEVIFRQSSITQWSGAKIAR